MCGEFCPSQLYPVRQVWHCNSIMVCGYLLDVIWDCLYFCIFIGAAVRVLALENEWLNKSYQPCLTGVQYESHWCVRWKPFLYLVPAQICSCLSASWIADCPFPPRSEIILQNTLIHNIYTSFYCCVQTSRLSPVLSVYKFLYNDIISENRSVAFDIILWEIWNKRRRCYDRALRLSIYCVGKPENLKVQNYFFYVTRAYGANTILIN